MVFLLWAKYLQRLGLAFCAKSRRTLTIWKKSTEKRNAQFFEIYKLRLEAEHASDGAIVSQKEEHLNGMEFKQEAGVKAEGRVIKEEDREEDGIDGGEEKYTTSDEEEEENSSDDEDTDTEYEDDADEDAKELETRTRKNVVNIALMRVATDE